MAGEHVTIVLVDDAVKASPQIRAPGSVAIERVHVAELDTAIASGRARGAVVVVGATVDANQAIERGADEVITTTDSASIENAIRKARARAAVRHAETAGVAGQELGGLVLLSAAVGHEINNPLSVATANCAVLEELVLPFADAVSQILERAESAKIDRTDIERLLKLAEHESLIEIRGALVDLSAALRSVANVVRQMAALTERDSPEMCDLCNVLVEFATFVHRDVERAADLTVDVPDYPCIVAMGRARAIAVLSALVQNALTALEERHRPAGSIALRVGIDSGMVVLEVADNGPGMSPEIRRQALNPFFTTRRPSALGLGLTFAARHVRQAGGEVLIDSEVDVGTTVRLFFPPASTVPSALWRGDEESTN